MELRILALRFRIQTRKIPHVYSVYNLDFYLHSCLDVVAGVLDGAVMVSASPAVGFDVADVDEIAACAVGEHEFGNCIEVADMRVFVDDDC